MAEFGLYWLYRIDTFTQEVYLAISTRGGYDRQERGSRDFERGLMLPEEYAQIPFGF